MSVLGVQLPEEKRHPAHEHRGVGLLSGLNRWKSHPLRIECIHIPINLKETRSYS